MSEAFRIHPPISPCPEQSGWGFARDDWFEDRAAERKLSQKKRLTDAELAAEYYAQDSRCRHEQWIEAVRGDDDYTDAERAGASRMYGQLSMLHRFATLPHYDEPQS